MLAVCDDQLMFRYYYIGAYGSAHDARVMRCSRLPDLLAASDDELVILGKLNNDADDFFLVIFSLINHRSLMFSAD